MKGEASQNWKDSPFAKLQFYYCCCNTSMPGMQGAAWDEHGISSGRKMTECHC